MTSLYAAIGCALRIGTDKRTFAFMFVCFFTAKTNLGFSVAKHHLG